MQFFRKSFSFRTNNCGKGIRFAEEGIHFDYANENPEVGNTSFQDFEVKLYFNVGIDDKFGFEPEADWIKVIEVLGRF